MLHLCSFSGMCPNMPFKIYILYKTLSTLVTFIWFLSRMCSNMSFKIQNYNKTLSVLATLIWFLSRMCPNMPFKIYNYNITLSVLATLIWLLSRMCPKMPFKIYILYKTLYCSSWRWFHIYFMPLPISSGINSLKFQIQYLVGYPFPMNGLFGLRAKNIQGYTFFLLVLCFLCNFGVI